jgi:drug/metabolite transporter (DMT)-like permease
MMTNRRRGLVLVVFSALLFSTPGIFTRAVVAGGWEVSFWRGFFGALFMVLFLLWRGGLKDEFRALGGPGLLAAAVWASGSIAYIMAFKLTSIANVSLIYGSAPVLSALVAWLVLRERPRAIVLAASLLAFVGVAIVAWGSLGRSNLSGDVLALWMTFTVAVQFAIFRKYPRTSALATTVAAALLVLPPSIAFGSPQSVAPPEIAVLAIFGFVFVCAATMLTEGSKHLPASETALVSNLEVPVQPLLAFAIFAELPPIATFLGGGLIIVAVLLSQLRNPWANRPTREDNT